MHHTSDITVLHNNDLIFSNIKDSFVKICQQIFRFGPSLIDEHSRPDSPARVEIIDSVNGLVCFSHNHAKSVLYIWNPVTNFFTTIYKPAIPSDKIRIETSSSLFYYDPFKADMKIMHIELLCSKKRIKSIRIHLYSFDTRVWKEIKDETLPVPRFETMGSVKSGPSYAYVHFLFHNTSLDMLVAFDFENEVFKLLPRRKPSVRDHYIKWMDSLGTVNDQVIYTLDAIRGTWFEKCIVPNTVKKGD